MQSQKKIFAAASLTAFLAINSSLFAMGCVEPWSDWSVSGGWRIDRVTEVNSFSKVVMGERTTFLKDYIKGKNLNIWQIGTQLHLSVPKCESQCEDYWWVNSIFLRGNAYYGWITHGDYKDFKPITVDINKAKARDGNTFDGTVGLGFLIPIYDWSFGPVGGYAYDQIHFKLRHAETDGTPNSALNGSSYHTRWQGWWLGADTAYRVLWDDYSLKFEGGYEYHWAHYHSHFRLKDSDDENFNQFTFHAHSHNASGNLFYLNSWWNFWDCLDLGLGFKYQFWKAGHGDVDRADFDVDPTEDDDLRHANWHSFGITLDVAYHF